MRFVVSLVVSLVVVKKLPALPDGSVQRHAMWLKPMPQRQDPAALSPVTYILMLFGHTSPQLLQNLLLASRDTLFADSSAHLPCAIAMVSYCERSYLHWLTEKYYCEVQHTSHRVVFVAICEALSMLSGCLHHHFQKQKTFLFWHAALCMSFTLLVQHSGFKCHTAKVICSKKRKRKALHVCRRTHRSLLSSFWTNAFFLQQRVTNFWSREGDMGATVAGLATTTDTVSEGGQVTTSSHCRANNQRALTFSGRS